MKMFGIFLLLLLLTSASSLAAPHGVTVPAQTTMTNRFLPYAGSGTQLIGNSPAWRDSAGVLGINNYLEGLETLTPGAAVNLDFSTWRTKRITLNQNTVFTAINIPSASTNVQTMLLEVIGDGAFTVSFANVTFQTPEITTPEAGVVTLYGLRGDNGTVRGYTEAVTATGIGPLTSGYISVANGTNNLTDSIAYQNGTNNIVILGHGPADATNVVLIVNTTVNQPAGHLVRFSNNGVDQHLFFSDGEAIFGSSTLDGPAPDGSTSYLWDTTVTHSSNANTHTEFLNTSSFLASINFDGSLSVGARTNYIVAASSGYTGAGTLFLSDDGTYKAGSGFSLWSGSSGNLTPSPAVDVVSIQSQSADNATNNVLIIDTGSNWVTSGAKLQAWRRNGTNLMSFGIGPTGSSIFSVGDNSSVIRTQIEGGTGDYAEIFTLGTSQYGYDLYADGSESYFELRAGGAGKLKFYPAASDGVVPYIFDTSVSHTSTNLLEIANNGTNKVTVDYSGNVTASAFTPDLQTVSYASSVTVDFSGRSSLWTVLAGDMTLASANLAIGRRIEYRIDNQQTTNCNVILPSGWRFVSGVVTNVLAASKIGLLTARSYSTTDTNVVAMWSSE